jgi:hypothetical protein
MDKKAKTYFTNENLSKKFKNNFELVNYAIQLAENMIKTGRDARVRSDLQNRAMLILEEINEGKDQFDEIQETTSCSSQGDLNGELQQQPLVYEEQIERRQYRTVEAHDDE